MPSTDPFFLVRDDIQASLEKAQTRYLQWQNAAQSSSEKKPLEQEVDDECKSILWQVDEMEKAVDVAESNMARFGLTLQDIQSRRKWVRQTRQQAENITKGLQTKAVQKEQRSEARGGHAGGRLGAAISAENDRYIDNEHQQQQQLLRQQDDDLDQLGEHVVRIGQMGRQIGEELGTQNQMLSELDADMDSTSNRLAAAQKKMTHVLKKAGMRGQLCIIGVLLVLLVVLLLVAFSS